MSRVKKRKARRLTQKEIKKKFCASGMNIEAIERNTEKYILESGIFPGMAKDIKLKRKYSPKKRLYRKEAAYISR